MIAQCMDSRENADYVSFQDRGCLFKRNGWIRAGSVASNAGKFLKILSMVWNCAAIFRDQLRGYVEHTRAAVIAESGHMAQDISEWCACEQADIRNPFKPLPIIRKDCRNLRLLEHDFRDPDFVR